MKIDANDIAKTAGIDSLRDLIDNATPWQTTINGNGAAKDNVETTNPRSPNGGAKPATLVSRCTAEIEPEKIDWLWDGRLARGKHTCIAGEPGVGKSQLSTAIVAAVTTLGDWPCRNLLERKIREIGDVALVVVDPVSSYLGKTDSHKNSEVRGVLEPLSEMADRTGVAILSVTHLTKPSGNGSSKALHRFLGRIAFTGAPELRLLL